MEPLNIPLRVVFYREDGDIVAHCLEFDLVGCGSDHEEAMDCLVEAIACQVDATLESGNIDNLFSPAPGEYFRMFAAGKSEQGVGKGIGRLQIHRQDVNIPNVDARDYVDSDAHNGDLALA